MFKVLFNKVSLYLVICMLYLSQGMLLGEGSSISKVFMLLYLSFGGYYFYKANKIPDRPAFIKALNAFIVLLVIYAIYARLFIGGYVITENNLGNVSIPLDFGKNILFGFFPMYAFYYFARNKLLTFDYLKVLAIVILLLNISLYFHSYESKLIASLTDRTEFTNNVGYEFVGFIPCLLLFYKSNMTNVSIALVLVYFIISGMKRGAILIGAILLAIYFIQVFKNSSLKTRILFLLGSIVVLFFICQMVIYMMDNSDWFQLRVQRTLDGNASNRESMYPLLWTYFLEQTNFFTLIFGSGADYTIQVCGNYAHNDWLELAVDCGLIGVVLYIRFYVYLLQSRKLLKENKFWSMMILFIFIFVGIRTFFSMSYGDVPLSSSIILGVALAQICVQYDVDNPLNVDLK